MRFTSVFATLLALTSTQFAFAVPLPGSDTASSHEVAVEPTHGLKQTTLALTLNESQEPHQLHLEKRVSVTQGPLTAQQHAQQSVAHHANRDALNNLAQQHEDAHDTSLRHAQEAESEGQSGAAHRAHAQKELNKAQGYRQEADLENLAGSYHHDMNRAQNSRDVATGRQEKANKYEGTRKGDRYQDEADAATREAAFHRTNAQNKLTQLQPHLIR
ncbi:hypothetical protein FRC14_006935 [Serendipita sp. 396]|nr:hypothetical protein FRC14_006935 [Serendipita sp. 396]KAG8778374.1 hypothetical protein FRC15_010835 [Serendipita sp. 397]KAG8795196.1 hypothetical protein FRC16_010186 [Serendipita sp. 398]KAG8814567.1 hypothetical protein FRC19_001647 [Serendipita sp. 401]KAG8843489.1 hypothetical protein FRB91_003334 [Serendipita sp. 411]KAG8851608.1 hypothetical protein FRC20_001707 [Serendipita sp. 405]KAG9048627.1 hypothetical protein FS842_000352 [Serendipita sp. 407]